MTVDSFFSSVPYHPIWYSAEPPGILEYVEHLELLLTPFLNSESSRTKISPCILLSGPLGCGKLTIVKALSRRLNMHFYQVNCHEVTGDSPGSTENRLKAMLQKTAMFAPCILALKNVDAVGREKELLGDDPRVLSTFCNTIKCLNVSSTQWPVIIIATTSESHSKVLSVEFSGTFLHLIKVKPPNEKERKAMIEGFLEVCPRGNDVNASYLAQRTAGFVLGDFSALVSQAVWYAYRRIRKTVKDYSLSVEEEEDICYAGILLLQKDLLESLEFLQAKHAEAIGAPKIPNVHWEDIGGMSDIKQEILDTIQLPLQHPELMASGFHRSGLLLYGPPGTGKTLLAKAVATECSLNFLSVKGPELINMYVGQSEENVREVFQRARYATPCVIFFDELDSLAPHRGNSGDSGGVMDRVVSQLLAELDGLHKAAEVFVIGATNRPDLLDRALLRPGRFDRLVYVGIPEEKASRLKILKALTRKFTLGTDLDLEVLVDKCPPSLTGADFYSLCSNAMMNALGRNIHEIETGRINVSDACMVIEERDFDVALQNLTPSVSPEELKKYQNIKL